VTGIAHDSILCSNSEDNTGVQKCEEPSHNILKLVKRDDRKAREIAQEHGMVVKVCFFFGRIWVLNGE